MQHLLDENKYEQPNSFRGKKNEEQIFVFLGQYEMCFTESEGKMLNNVCK